MGGPPKSDNTKFYKLLGIESDAGEQEIKKVRAERRAERAGQGAQGRDEQSGLSSAAVSTEEKTEQSRAEGRAAELCRRG
eukprot:1348272-Rhodomonas_salina.1